MDIKVLKNLGDVKFEHINDKFILIIEKNPDKILDRFISDRIFMLNPSTGEKTEIASDIEKYFTEDLVYAYDSKDYVVFPTASITGDNEMTITYYIYSTEDRSLKQLHSMAVDIDTFGKQIIYKTFVLDNTHLLIQKEIKNYKTGGSSFNLILYNWATGAVSNISIPYLVENGIHSLIPLGNNQCLVKVGSPFIAESINFNIPLAAPNEHIAIIHINQFISELSINMSTSSSKIVEASKENTTLPYVRFNGSQIIYAIYYIGDDKEEIIVYDIETGAKTVRLNTKVSRLNDLRHTFVVDGTPYIITESSTRHSKVVDLNTQKVIMKLDIGDDIPFVAGNFVVMSRSKKKMFGQKSEYVEVYKFPDIYKDPVLSIKASYGGAMLTGEDLIIITK